MRKQRESSDLVGLRLRFKEHLRARVEKAADEHKVSLNEEIVSRLQKSFDEEDIVERTLGGPEVAGLSMVLSRVLHEAGVVAGMYKGLLGSRWLQDPYCFDQAVHAVNAVLEGLRPKGEIAAPRFTSEPPRIGDELTESAERIGRRLAAAFVDAILDPDTAPTEDLQAFGREVRQKLTPASAEQPQKKRA